MLVHSPNNNHYGSPLRPSPHIINIRIRLDVAIINDLENGNSSIDCRFWDSTFCCGSSVCSQCNRHRFTALMTVSDSRDLLDPRGRISRHVTLMKSLCFSRACPSGNLSRTHSNMICVHCYTTITVTTLTTRKRNAIHL